MISIDMISILIILQVGLLIYAAMTDVATRLIPNKVCLMLAVLGITSTLLIHSDHLIESLIISITLFLVLLITFSRGWIGGGDVKLLASLALGLSLAQLFQMLTVMALAGGGLALLHLVMRQLPYPHRSANPSLLRRIYIVERWRHLRHAPLPYAVAIAFGGLWTILHGV